MKVFKLIHMIGGSKSKIIDGELISEPSKSIYRQVDDILSDNPEYEVASLIPHPQRAINVEEATLIIQLKQTK